MSGLGINPGSQSQIAVSSLFVEQIVPGPQGLGSQGSGRMHPVIVSGLGINPGWQSQTAIAPFSDDMLKEHSYESRKELTDAMFATMKKYGGIGLTCNQVGLPFNMFVAGGHPSIDGGKSFTPVSNPHSDKHDLWINPDNPQNMILEM